MNHFRCQGNLFEIQKVSSFLSAGSPIREEANDFPVASLMFLSAWWSSLAV